MEVAVKDRGDGTYSCSYTPRKALKHTAVLAWGGVNIPHSPYRVSCPTAPHTSAPRPIDLHPDP